MAKRENLFFGKILFFDGREYDPCTPEPDVDPGSGGTPMNTTEKELSPEHITFMTHLGRKRSDRRVLYGKWSRYQIREKAIPTAFSYFTDDWILLRHDDLYFPEDTFTNQTEILKIGFRRALHAHYPTHRFPKADHHDLKARVNTTIMYQRSLAAMDDLEWREPNIFYRSDPETPYIDYINYFFETRCRQHAIKIELDLDKIPTDF